MAKKILLPAERLVDSNIKIGQRDGTIIEKGVILNENYLEENKEKIGSVMSIFSAYPDVYLDVIKPQDSSFTLFFYQRITLRAIMRFKDVFGTAPRAFSKSFITILAMILQCIFIPGTKRFICAPNKTQAAQIAKEKIVEISPGEITVYLRAKPHDGEANVALIKMLAKHFKIPKTTIKITRGLKSRSKTIEF